MATFARTMTAVAVLLLLSCLSVACGLRAVCDLFHFESSRFVGQVNFTQESSLHRVYLSGFVTSLTPGQHGIHVHEFGSVAQNCNGAGGHFNPANKNHGAPNDNERHVGDLGNLYVQPVRDIQSIQIEDGLITLYPGPHNILGRVLAIHEKEDDLGRGGDAASLANGNSGPRIVCGVIGIAK